MCTTSQACITPTDVAQAIITQYLKKNNNLNITKLNKLLYIVFGIYLIENGEPIFDELPLCLPHGPVFNSSYQSYKIGKLDLSCDYKKADSEIMDLVERVVSEFGDWTASELVEWTHRIGGAWSKTEQSTNYWGIEIKLSDIKEEFYSLLS